MSQDVSLPSRNSARFNSITDSHFQVRSCSQDNIGCNHEMEELLQHFNWFTHNQRRWVWVEDLNTLLRTQPLDATKPSRVDRTLKGYKQEDSIHIIDGKQAIPLRSLLMFMFSKSNVSNLCSEFVSCVEDHVTLPCKRRVESPAEKTIFDLYKHITSSDIGLAIINTGHVNPTERDIQRCECETL